MKKRGHFESETPVHSVKGQISCHGKYLGGCIAGKRVSRHLQMMVTSAVSMVLCCTMFLGTTLAWFTDSVTSAGNKITIGTLEVDITYDEKSLNPDKDEHVDYVFDPKIVWKPDLFEARKLTVENTGNLPVVYVLNLLPSDYEIAEYFDVYVTTDPKAKTGTLLTKAERKGWEFRANLADPNYSVFTKELAAGSKQEIGIALRMTTKIDDEELMNKLFGQNFELFIMLNAYQDTLDQSEIRQMNAETAGKVDFSDPVQKEEEPAESGAVITFAYKEGIQNPDDGEGPAVEEPTDEDTSGGGPAVEEPIGGDTGGGPAVEESIGDDTGDGPALEEPTDDNAAVEEPTGNGTDSQGAGVPSGNSVEDEILEKDSTDASEEPVEDNPGNDLTDDGTQ